MIVTRSVVALARHLCHLGLCHIFCAVAIDAHDRPRGEHLLVDIATCRVGFLLSRATASTHRHRTRPRGTQRCLAALPVLLCLGAQYAGLDDAVGRENLSQDAAQENEACRPRDAADVRAEAAGMLRSSGEYA